MSAERTNARYIPKTAVQLEDLSKESPEDADIVTARRWVLDYPRSQEVSHGARQKTDPFDEYVNGVDGALKDLREAVDAEGMINDGA